MVGDSLKLAQAAQHADCEVIAFCGVHFMAETAKILNPDKPVVVPDLEAGCSLADGCPPGRVPEVHRPAPRRRRPHLHQLLRRGEGDVRPHLHVVERGEDDRSTSLGGRSSSRPTATWRAGSAKQTGRDDLIVWPGACVVHELFSAKGLEKLRIQHPDAEVLAHPECDQAVLDQADFIASTTGIIERAVASPDRESIIATEDGVFHEILRRAPGKKLIQAPGMDESCSCNQCPYMRLNTLEKLYLCLRDLEAPGDGARGDPRSGAEAHRADAQAELRPPAEGADSGASSRPSRFGRARRRGLRLRRPPGRSCASLPPLRSAPRAANLRPSRRPQRELAGCGIFATFSLRPCST